MYCCENKSKVGMETFPDSERRQERRFNRKGIAMNMHRDRRLNALLLRVFVQIFLYRPFR